MPRRRPRAVYTVCDADELLGDGEGIGLDSEGIGFNKEGIGFEGQAIGGAEPARSAIGHGERAAPDGGGARTAGRVLTGVLACVAASCLLIAIALMLVRLLDGALAGDHAVGHRRTAHLALPVASRPVVRAVSAGRTAHLRRPPSAWTRPRHVAHIGGGALAKAVSKKPLVDVKEPPVDVWAGSQPPQPASDPVRPAVTCGCRPAVLEFGFER